MVIDELNFLAVDDHEFQLSIVPRMLVKLGATRVVIASDGKAALAVVRAKAPAIDIIVTDLDMPDMDGTKIIPPSAFNATLEESGMIDRLTLPMLEQSAEFSRRWHADNPFKLTVSVNLSAKSLVDPTLADRITALVRARNVDPSTIIFELTESAAATDVGPALENLSRLRMKGFGLSIDDYGTGYSLMRQLTRIAFTELKIDQFFVTNAGRQQSASVILESSLDMARKLGISAVAEGVETRESWDLLRKSGYAVAQRYFIARPMSADALLARVPAGGEAIIRLAIAGDSGA